MARTTGSHADITGPRIRRAAEALFARHGYAAVSMRQIASEVGVQVGGLYNYIPDKQSLLYDMMREHMAELLAACPDDANAAPVERLDDFVRFHIRFHHDRPDSVFIAYMELRNLAPDNFTAIEAMRSSYERKLEGIITEGVAQSEFRVRDARIATRALIAMLTGLTTWFRSGGRLTLADIEEHYLQMVRGALGAPPIG